MLFGEKRCHASSEIENGSWRDCCQSGVNQAIPVYRDKPGSTLDWLNLPIATTHLQILQLNGKENPKTFNYFSSIVTSILSPICLLVFRTQFCCSELSVVYTRKVSLAKKICPGCKCRILLNFSMAKLFAEKLPRQLNSLPQKLCHIGNNVRLNDVTKLPIHIGSLVVYINIK